jgi:hypothetical protein
MKSDEMKKCVANAKFSSLKLLIYEPTFICLSRLGVP